MGKIYLIIITAILVIGIGIVLLGQPKGGPDAIARSGQNVELRNGVQYITITARGGYSPRISRAQANVPTKLIVKTNGTYDCSASLIIQSIGYQKILARTGEETIDLGTPQPGLLQGLCGMGMYNFTVNFS